MRTKNWLGLLLVVGLLSSGAIAQSTDKVDAYVQGVMKERKIPGIALLVVQDNKVVLSKGYGFSNVELQVPVNPETVFQSGSMGKQFTATAVMRFYPAPFDRAGVEEWIARNQRRYLNDGVGLWAMVEKSTGDLIGDCGITKQGVDGELLYEIGYHLRRDRWGQGFATEAAQACKAWGFANLSVDRIISLIRPENVPSRHAGLSFRNFCGFISLSATSVRVRSGCRLPAVLRCT